jgi:hypothetical protein
MDLLVLLYTCLQQLRQSLPPIGVALCLFSSSLLPLMQIWC